MPTQYWSEKYLKYPLQSTYTYILQNEVTNLSVSLHPKKIFSYSEIGPKNMLIGTVLLLA